MQTFNGRFATFKRQEKWKSRPVLLDLASLLGSDGLFKQKISGTSGVGGFILSPYLATTAVADTEGAGPWIRHPGSRRHPNKNIVKP